jgi:hypothetical protein
LKFYRNGVVGDDKLAKGYEVTGKTLDSVVEEIHEGVINNIKEVNDKILSNLAIAGAQEEKKYVVIYYYDDEIISLHFKAISAMSILKDKFIFLALFEPSSDLLEQLTIKTLPAIGGVLPGETEDAKDLK